jgi:hypothetical protein
MKPFLGLLAVGLLIATTGATLAAPPPPPPGSGPHLSFGFGFGPSYPPYSYYPHRQHFYSDCLSTEEIYASLADDGYYRIRIEDEARGHLILIAIRHHQPVRLVVDRCSGNVIDEHPIYY